MESTREDNAEQVHEEARNATRTCFDRFQSCIAVLTGEHQAYLEARFADLKLWADSVGALAPGKASLDWRLSGRPNDVLLVTSLLDMLERFLEGYKEVAAQDPSEDEVHEAKQGIDDMTDNLAWIGSAIRRAGTKSRLQKADDCFERDRAGKDKMHFDQLQAHLTCIVKSRPTENARSEDYLRSFHDVELEGIQRRLVEANLRRWHRFRYAQCHSDILKATRAVQSMPKHFIAEGPAREYTVESNTNPLRINKAVAKQRNEANDHSETRTTADLSASGFGSEYKGLQGRYTRPARSTMSRISTITGTARFPKARRPQSQQKTLLCPCCCQALPLEEAEDPDLWAKHMKHDIAPYSCIVNSCPTPYRLYVTRNEWKEHVLRDHPPKWRCCCCKGSRPVFQSLPSFMAHLDEQHSDQVSDGNFNRIMAKSAFRAFGITDCPLCDDHGPTDSPELIEHVLGHIYDFSMYALPWPATPRIEINKQIRTFNDIAPEPNPDTGEEAVEMRMLSHTRILEWVREPHPDEEGFTSEKKAVIRDLDWDDYQAVEGEDSLVSIGVDYFDRAGIDYFDDNASSRRGSSQLSLSADTRRPSTSSGSEYSGHNQVESNASQINLIENEAQQDEEEDRGNFSLDQQGNISFRLSHVNLTGQETQQDDSSTGACLVHGCHRLCVRLPDGRQANHCDQHLPCARASQGCRRPALPGSKLCPDHKCYLQRCPREKALGSDFCQPHECAYQACHQSVADSSDERIRFCVVHKCAAHSCLEASRITGIYCSNHSCNYGRCKAQRKGNTGYCDQHPQPQPPLPEGTEFRCVNCSSEPLYEGRKKIATMWRCCRCGGGLWNSATTPACLECAHSFQSREEIIRYTYAK